MVFTTKICRSVSIENVFCPRDPLAAVMSLVRWMLSVQPDHNCVTLEEVLSQGAEAD